MNTKPKECLYSGSCDSCEYYPCHMTQKFSKKPARHSKSIKIYSPPLLAYLVQKLLKMKIKFSCIHDDIVLTNKKDFKKVNTIIKKLTEKITA